MKLVTAAQMRAIEQAAFNRGETSETLMDLAGQALAAETTRLLGGAHTKRVVVLAGPGNNGGDGYVAARYLAGLGAQVTVVPAVARRDQDEVNAALSRHAVHITPDAATDFPAAISPLADADAVIDALLGTGANRGLEGVFAQLTAAVLARKTATPATLVVAADTPSGLDADTGEATAAVLPCDATVTFGFPKLGHLRGEGPRLTGRLVIADIGLRGSEGVEVATDLLTPGDAAALLPARTSDANKGTFGRVLVVGGCTNYMGAPFLAGRTALRAGAGLLTVATVRTATLAMASGLPEATHLPLAEAPDGGVAATASNDLADYLRRYDTLVLGCGLGQGSETTAFLLRLLEHLRANPIPTVVDADALNLLAQQAKWWQLLPPGCILTPHPGEMARLRHAPVRDVQADRLAQATDAATAWGHYVVLKGAHTVIANPNGRVAVAPFANPALATAGTGDVLAGITGALLAQALVPADAARAGVLLHGLAGEQFAERHGTAGLLASELTDTLPDILRDLRAGRTTGWGNLPEERPLHQ